MFNCHDKIAYAYRLLFDLGYRALVFTLTTNLESGPRFAEIWLMLLLVLLLLLQLVLLWFLLLLLILLFLLFLRH